MKGYIRYHGYEYEMPSGPHSLIFTGEFYTHIKSDDDLYTNPRAPFLTLTFPHPNYKDPHHSGGAARSANTAFSMGLPRVYEGMPLVMDPTTLDLLRTHINPKTAIPIFEVYVDDLTFNWSAHVDNHNHMHLTAAFHANAKSLMPMALVDEKTLGDLIRLRPDFHVARVGTPFWVVGTEQRLSSTGVVCFSSAWGQLFDRHTNKPFDGPALKARAYVHDLPAVNNERLDDKHRYPAHYLTNRRLRSVSVSTGLEPYLMIPAADRRTIRTTYDNGYGVRIVPFTPRSRPY